MDSDRTDTAAVPIDEDVIRSSAFFREVSFQPREEYCDAALWLLLSGGLDSLTFPRVAKHCRVVHSAVVQQAGSKAGLIEMITGAFVHRWTAWVLRPGLYADVPIRLPRRTDEIHAVRVHLALSELARGEAAQGREAPARIIAAAAGEERDFTAFVLHRRLERELSQSDLDATMALITGVRAAVVSPVDPLPIERADRILRQHLYETLHAPPLAENWSWAPSGF